MFADGVWQKFEVAGGSGYLGQGPAEVLAGLGAATHAEIVRILWPTGVPQDEIDLADVRTISLEEIDRRGSSCPVVFSWDGSQYRFVSDIIGAAVVGHWVSPHKTNRQDADEWLKIEGDSLKPRNGLLSVRVGEPMEEINYIDQVRLVAVDHPSSIQTYPEERFLSEPPFASGAAIATSAARPVSGAWDNGGNDVTELLRAQDHRYVTDFANLPFAGFAKPHTLTLDLDAWSPTRPLRLLFHGYVEYFSASSMYSAWQSGLSPMPPMVEEQLPDGSWHRIVDDMGFPAGLARTIVVDLTGRLDPAVTRIRLTTNLQIYWDEVLVDNGENRSSELRQTELPLRTAHLAFRGYPQQVSGATPGDLTYRYDRISSTGPFLWGRGSYTRFGEVTSLLKEIDDRPVVFGTGEEIDAEFDPASLPVLPAGWTRDYMFYANGFVKDMDFYEALPYTVAQMPFHGMSTYPYPEDQNFPDDPAAISYQLRWNSRFESGDRIQRYVFDYQAVHLQPTVGDQDHVAP